QMNLQPWHTRGLYGLCTVLVFLMIFQIHFHNGVPRILMLTLKNIGSGSTNCFHCALRNVSANMAHLGIVCHLHISCLLDDFSNTFSQWSATYINVNIEEYWLRQYKSK